MKLGLTAVAAVIVVAAGATYWKYIADDDHRNRGPGGSFGEIFVDSPEIYTRERLVNDRFREDAWLKEMLELLSKEEAALQGFIRTTAKDSRSVRIGGGAGLTDSADEAAGDEPGASAEPPGSTADDSRQDPETQSVLRDRFQHYLDIRDAIRKQIVENQLDDRHDLSANTLYAFKFDVTVLPPGNDTSAWAKITVTISESDQSESDGLVAGAKERLFLRWVSHLETVTNGAYLEQNKSLEMLSDEFKQTLLAYVLSDDFKYSLSGIEFARDDEVVEGRLKRVVDELDRHAAGIDPLSWLIAQWVIYDQITSRNLDTYVEVSTRTLAGSLNRIVVKPRTVERQSPASGFEFEEFLGAAQFEPAVKGDGNGRVPTDGSRDPFEQLLNPEAVAEASRLSAIDGLIEFRKLFVGRAQTLFTYSVSPKVSVENVAEAGSYTATRELTSKLQASNSVANVNTAVDLARQLDSTVGAIRRNALIVGFSDRKRADERQARAVFGWYIGPRFQLSEDGRGYQFRHVPNQHALSALIALPVGWPEVKVSVKTEWVREDGSRAYPGNEKDRAGQLDSQVGETQQPGIVANDDTYTYYVELPTDPDKVTAALSIGSPKSENLGPIVYESQLEEKIALAIGQPGAVLIPGRNLWRSTVVTIGAQLSDRITVLPNMEGIVAHFDEVLPAPTVTYSRYAGLSYRCAPQVIRVWTSTGLAKLDTKAELCESLAASQE